MPATQSESRKIHPQLLQWEDGQQADAYAHEGDLVVFGENGQADPSRDTIIINTENGGEYFIRSGQAFDVNATEASGEAQSVRLADLTSPLGSIAIGGSLKIPRLTPGTKVRSVVVRREESIQSLAVTPVAGSNPFSRTDRRLYQALNPEAAAAPPPRQKPAQHKHNQAQPKQRAPQKPQPRRPRVNPVKAGGVRYRTEHSRSVEDAPKFKALETLKKLGVIQPAAKAEIIHGRAARIGEGSWSVDPHRSGSVDNVFTRSSLYAASRGTAHEFAQARVKQMRRNGVSEVEAKLYIVTSSDADAMIIDGLSNYSHPARFKTQEYRDAVDALLPDASWGAPVSFDDRASVPGVYTTLMRHFDAQYAEKGLRTRLTSRDITTVAVETGAAKSLVTSLAGNINARTLIKRNLDDAADEYLRSANDIVDEVSYPHEAPLSLEYIGKFMREAHIVGYRTDVRSGTLGKYVEIVSLFDTQKVNARVRLQRG